MTFASPAWLWSLLAAIPIIAFYILRTQPRRHTVSTLLFWDQVFDDRRQRRWWQNLRRWLSLMLQLLFVVIVAVALADPVLKDRTASLETILVIDNSASMNAVDQNGQTRLEIAKRRAGELANQLRPGDSMAVVTAGSTVGVAAGMGDFSPAVIEAIDGIEPTDGPTRLEEAIQTARRMTGAKSTAEQISPDQISAQQSAATAQDNRRIVVISDREIQTDPATRLISIGESVDNAAITAISVRRSLVDPIGYSAWITAECFGEQPIDTRLSITLDSDLVDAFSVQIKPGEIWQRTIEGVSAAGGVMTATLKIDDALPSDNVARAILSPRLPIPVQLVVDRERFDSPAAFFLRSVLDSIALVRMVESETVSDSSIANQPSSNQPSSNQPAGLTVVLGQVPTPLPNGPLMIVEPRSDGPAGTFTLGEEIRSPIVAEQASDSPLMRHVRLTNVPLDRSRPVIVDPDFAPFTELIKTASGDAVAVSIDRPSGRIMILSTTLSGGDLPLRIAFPVMMTNALNWFMGRGSDIDSPLRTGNALPIEIDGDGDGDGEVTLSVVTTNTKAGTKTDSSSDPRRLLIDNRRVLIPPLDRAGVVSLSNNDGEQKRLLAVNLCDAEESDLGVAKSNIDDESSIRWGGFPPWWLLVGGAAMLIVGEWALFQRRVVA